MDPPNMPEKRDPNGAPFPRVVGSLRVPPRPLRACGRALRGLIQLGGGPHDGLDGLPFHRASQPLEAWRGDVGHRGGSQL